MIFRGRLDGEDLKAVYSRSHVLAMPFAQEGFGIAALEAMGFGLPVIGSSASGVREFVRHGENGFLVAPGDHESLRRHIELLHRDRGRLIAMGKAAYTTGCAWPPWQQSLEPACVFLEKLMASDEFIKAGANEANSTNSMGSTDSIDPMDSIDSRGRFRDSLGQALKLLVALSFLNAVLNMDAAIPGETRTSFLQLAPELLVLTIGMSLRVRRHARFRPAFYAPVAAAVIFLGLFRLADNLIPMVFNRPFNLYLDIRRLPDLVLLGWMLLSPTFFALAVAGVALALPGMAWGCVPLPQNPARRFTRNRPEEPCWRAWPPGRSPPGPGRTFALTTHRPWLGSATLPRVAEEMRAILDLEGTRRRDQAAIAAAIERSRHAPTNLKSLNRTPVFLFVVESYGQTVFSDPDHAARVVPVVKAAEADLRAAGFHMCSAYLASPTFGGSSWLAHGTLASGVRLNSQIRHDLLLGSDLVPLAEYFNRAGYRTVCAMPGTLWPSPAGRFFRFQRTVNAADFGYKGPDFAWAPMPDQYVLNRVYRQEIQHASDPLLVEFILVSSHAAFDLQAPYVEDWQLLGDGSLFNSLEALKFPGAWSDPPKLAEAYSAAIIYEVTLLREFIRRFLAGGELVIIMGDHQPCAPVTGRNASWSVPVHVISRNPDAIRRFVQRGYTEGLVPGQAPPHPGMETFFWNFLEDFSEPNQAATLEAGT